MATLHHDHAGQAMVYLKGAPERILDMCEAERVGDSVRPLDPDYWRRLATDTAARGLRLLAIARRAMPAEQRTLDFADVEHGFTLLALVGIIDPPREEAVAAVAECQAAGIAVKMITGDHVDTARAIGAMLGIGIDRPALTGAEIELLDDQRLREVLPGVDVFARASPEHKLRLVQALQASGEVVAMTGDGVNDAPALKRADVGVAMGNKGTEAAKEAAEVVLADDNFATIANAVREGRAVYDNLKKFILFMLPTNGGEALIVIAAILFQLTLPMTPAQILWINMVTSSTLGLALAFDPAERGLMQRPPRPPAEPVVAVLRLAGAAGLAADDGGRPGPVPLGAGAWHRAGERADHGGEQRGGVRDVLPAQQPAYLRFGAQPRGPVRQPPGLAGDRRLRGAATALYLRAAVAGAVRLGRPGPGRVGAGAAGRARPVLRRRTGKVAMSPGPCPAGLTPRGRPLGRGAVPLPVRRAQTSAPRIARPRAVARVAMGRQ